MAVNTAAAFQRCDLKLFSGILGITQFRKKSFYVTTPIFYVNAAPHIGHLYTATLADAACRWNNMKYNNQKSKLVTGTDEHGLKVLQAAQQSNMNAIQYCDKVSRRFKGMCSAFNIDYYDFIRTTEHRHHIAVTHFWNRLSDKGYIYKSSYEGWYCTSDETFVPSSEVNEVKDSKLGWHHIHTETKNKVIWTEEINYKFKLSLFVEKLLAWINDQPDVVEPETARKLVIKHLESLTDDLSVSRDRSRVPWGIPVPGDPSQTIYVWLDALVNYLTVCGYPDMSSSKFNDMWPADVHLVGVDIVKFHAIYWPAFLMAAEIELPKKILAHSHWTIDNIKMSKSKGNIVDPMTLSKTLTTTGMRYFLLRQGILEYNSNFSEVVAFQYVNSDLANGIGNTLRRATAKHLNPNQLYAFFHKSVFAGKACRKRYHAGVEEYQFIELVRSLPDLACEDADKFHFYKVVDMLGNLIRESNMIIQRHELWKLDQSITEQRVFVETLLYLVYEGMRVCGILLQPIIPGFADSLLNKLAVPVDCRSLKDAEKSFVELDGERDPLAGRPLPNASILFERLALPR